ncbi:hypothetical protein [Leptolyngbya ohadii]|uniref:hypothetical protein n=1 Tax=Leptolyngbya ohadii TaxID=1962290 RepID=UPI00117B40A3|nr:hypothetical protein [Leptolyngbya ohadii]
MRSISLQPFEHEFEHESELESQNEFEYEFEDESQNEFENEFGRKFEQEFEYEFEDELGKRGQAGRNPARQFAAVLKRQGFLPTLHFTERLLQRLLSNGVRLNPRTFAQDFRGAKHYRQTRPGYNTRIAVLRGIPIVYRPGGENGNRIVLVTALNQGDALPPVTRSAPPRQREQEWEFEAVPQSFDRRIQEQYAEQLQEMAVEREADPFVVENRLLRIPPGHETLNRQAARGLPLTSAELNALNRGVRRVDTEKLSNHFRPEQQRRHVLRRYKCQRLEEALAEARQQLAAIYRQILRAPTREAAFEWMGEALHLIQDSYSPAHTARESNGTGRITFIRYYRLDGLPYPQEHRVLPMRQPGRLMPLPVDPRDYVNLTSPPTRAAIAASRAFIQLILRHLRPAPSGVSSAQWNRQRVSELRRFMDSVLVLSPRQTPTKSFYPDCP